MGVFFRKSATAARSSPPSTPRTMRPWSLYCWNTFSTEGVALRHGPHQTGPKDAKMRAHNSCDTVTGMDRSKAENVGRESAVLMRNAGPIRSEERRVGKE